MAALNGEIEELVEAEASGSSVKQGKPNLISTKPDAAAKGVHAACLRGHAFRLPRQRKDKFRRLIDRKVALP
jgi:hypothetical protein